MKPISGWVGAAIVAVVVWLWDDPRVGVRYPRQSITGAHWDRPKLALLIWSWLFSHIVLKRPKRVLIWW